MAGITHREMVVTALNHETQDAVEPYEHRLFMALRPRFQMRTLLRCSKRLSSTGNTDGVGRPRPLNSAAI